MNKKTFRSILDARLSGVRVTENQKLQLYQQMQKEELPVKRKLSTSIVIVALLVVLLSGAALAAVGAARSQEAAIIQQMQEALLEKLIEGNPQASWSHDSADLEQAQAQMLEALQQKSAALEAQQALLESAPQAEATETPVHLNEVPVEVAWLETADQALMDQYGFTAETLALLGKKAISSEMNEEGNINVIYSAKDGAMPLKISQMVGLYFVTLDPTSGNILSVGWSDAHVWEDKDYTESNWGSAPTLHAKLFPFAVALMKEADALSETDKDAYDQLFRDAGFSDEVDYRPVIEAGDLPYEKAMAIAQQALMEEMKLTEALLAEADWYAEKGSLANVPIYVFITYVVDDGIGANYAVYMNAQTGEVLSVDVSTGGEG
jgi:antitoxin component HigA of HigAB toxin-antitoxin module